MADYGKDSGYDKERNGYVLKDGNLMRIQDKDNDGNVRITLYDGDERKKGEHDKTTITYNENTGKGRIDYHNEDKSEKETTDVSCFLTTACMRHMRENFDDNCYELDILRWFRDNCISESDKKEYYLKAPIIVEKINNQDNANEIYKDIYDNVISLCVSAIECGKYDFAYQTYKNCILGLEENYVNSKQKVLKYN